MKKNIRSKISGFLTSEEGRVSTKAPLALGVATGSVLLAQAMIPSTADAHFACDAENLCPEGEVCALFPELAWPGPTLVEWHTKCIDPDH